AVANSQLGRPAGPPNFGRAQEYERIIPHPATVATGELGFRFEAELVENPPDRIDHPAVVRRAKIVNLRPMLCFAGRAELHHMQNRGEAILHIQVTFTLGSVAENAQPIRMLKELAVEIENVTMRITFAENRDEPKDIPLEAEAFAIRLDQIFSCNLRCAVKGRLDRKRRVLGSRDYGRFAIN